MLLFPKKLEHLLLSYLKSTFYRGTKREIFIGKPFDSRDLKFFSKGAAELSRRFTSERNQLRGDYLNVPANRAGYLLYFLPINYTKASFVFRQIPAEFWEKKSFRLLDLGSGPGTASLAFLSEVAGRSPGAQVEFLWVDQNKKILADGQNLLEAWRNELKTLGKVSVKIISMPLQRFHPSGQYDLIVLNHVLNELNQMGALERAEWLAPRIGNNLKKQGLVALIEPALKRPGRELMALRDHLIEFKDYSVLAPCLHEKICPMLAGTRNDWCHFYIDWKEPAYLKQLDRLMGNENRFLKLSYILLGPKQDYGDRLTRPTRQFRVVSNRMATRGKTELILCGPGGRIRLTRLDRHASPKNEELDKTRRGDLVSLKNFRAQDFQVNGGYRVDSETPFNKIPKS